MPNKQIIALGGGGFAMEPDNPLLDHYIVEQATSPRPSICFLPTASGGSDRYIVDFYSAYGRIECQPSHLSFFRRTPELRETLLAQDIIFVGGGNTKSMLAIWREWDMPSILREAWEAGVVLAGVSAGAICWFEQGITDSFAYRQSVMPCLGFLSGSCCPHYDGEDDRRPAFHSFLQSGEIVPGYAAEDGVALHFVGDQLHRIVSSRPDARAYALAVKDGVVEETSLSPKYLGA